MVVTKLAWVWSTIFVTAPKTSGTNQPKLTPTNIALLSNPQRWDIDKAKEYLSRFEEFEKELNNENN